MNVRTNRRILLAAVPDGPPRPRDFALDDAALPELALGQVLVRHLWLGMSPSARLRMAGDSDYGPAMPVGSVVSGQTVGVVEASRNPGLHEGAIVMTNGGWQAFSVTRGTNAVRLDPAEAPPEEALGLFGTSGLTAYVGLLDIGRPRAGETLVVSAASGSVGSVAGQIGRILGCRVVGITGGDAKRRYLTETLGFDAAVDHRSPDFPEALAAACPAGVDVYFDNVGGRVRDAVWPLLAQRARVVVCGLISEYSDTTPGAGPPWFPILSRRLAVQGFLLRDHEDRRADFIRDVSAWHAEGRIRSRLDITVGLENAPAAFIRLLAGENFGKSIVKIDAP